MNEKLEFYQNEFLKINDALVKTDISHDQASVKFAQLMTKMESEFTISQLPKLNKNIDPEVMELYKILSDSRNL